MSFAARRRESGERPSTQLELALSAGGLGAWQWNIRTGEVHWSQSLEEIYGLAPGSFDGSYEASQRDVHPEDRARVLETIRRSVEEGRHELAYRIILPDGRVRWLKATGEVIRDANGDPVRMVGVCTDITNQYRRDLRQAFLAKSLRVLAGSLSFDETVQNATNLAVPEVCDWCAIDLLEQGALRRVAISHVNPDKLALAEEIHKRYPPDLSLPFGVGQVLRTGEPEVGNVTPNLLKQASKDEEHHDLLKRLGLGSYTIVPIFLEDKTFGTIVAASEAKNAFDDGDVEVAQQFASSVSLSIRNALLFDKERRAVQSREQTLAIVSHDLRSPLSVVSLAVSALRSCCEGNENALTIANRIDTAAGQMTRLISDLLDAASIDQGRLGVRLEQARAGELLMRAKEQVQAEAADKCLNLRVMGALDVTLRCDPARILQVISNLVGNSLSVAPIGSRVDLEIQQEPDEVTFVVRDEGPGIAQENLRKIFKPFWRESATQYQGTGLGLHISRGIVQAHGGKIWAESEPGVRTEIKFSIPQTTTEFC